jgi:hypothetical protein
MPRPGSQARRGTSLYLGSRRGDGHSRASAGARPRTADAGEAVQRLDDDVAPLGEGERKDTADADLERRERRFSAACDGFDVHCAVRIAAEARRSTSSPSSRRDERKAPGARSEPPIPLRTPRAGSNLEGSHERRCHMGVLRKLPLLGRCARACRARCGRRRRRSGRPGFWCRQRRGGSGDRGRCSPTCCTWRARSGCACRCSWRARRRRGIHARPSGSSGRGWARRRSRPGPRGLHDPSEEAHHGTVADVAAPP